MMICCGTEMQRIATRETQGKPVALYRCPRCETESRNHLPEREWFRLHAWVATPSWRLH